jgi:hypothetical protein
MRSLFLLAPLLSSTVIQIAGCPIISFPPESNNAQPPVRVTLDDGFEGGLANWVQDSDAPEDPGNPGQDVTAIVELSTEQAFQGVHSARFSLDGRLGDGTLWLEHLLILSPEQNYRVALSFALWSETQSANTIAFAAAFGGSERPRREEDFDTFQAASQIAGWKQYSYTFDLTTDATGRVWVAYGISAALPMQLRYFVDDVHIAIDPR